MLINNNHRYCLRFEKFLDSLLASWGNWILRLGLCKMRKRKKRNVQLKLKRFTCWYNRARKFVEISSSVDVKMLLEEAKIMVLVVSLNLESINFLLINFYRQFSFQFHRIKFYKFLRRTDQIQNDFVVWILRFVLLRWMFVSGGGVRVKYFSKPRIACCTSLLMPAVFFQSWEGMMKWKKLQKCVWITTTFEVLFSVELNCSKIKFFIIKWNSCVFGVIMEEKKLLFMLILLYLLDEFFIYGGKWAYVCGLLNKLLNAFRFDNWHFPNLFKIVVSVRESTVLVIAI